MIPTSNQSKNSCASGLICLDVDGTLIDSQGYIHPKDRKIFASLSRHPGQPAWFVITTGRPLQAVRDMFTFNGLFIDQKIPLPLVLINGAAVYMPGEVLQAYFPFEEDIQAQLLAISRQNPQVSAFFFTQDQIDLAFPNQLGLYMVNRFHLEVRTFGLDSLSKKFCKLMLISPDIPLLYRLAAQMQELPVEIAFSDKTVLEINPQKVTKASGIRLLIDALGLDGVRLFAAGDGENDLPILDLADRSYAPSTAPTNVRDRVKQVVDVPFAGLLSPILLDVASQI